MKSLNMSYFLYLIKAITLSIIVLTLWVEIAHAQMTTDQITLPDYTPVNGQHVSGKILEIGYSGELRGEKTFYLSARILDDEADGFSIDGTLYTSLPGMSSSDELVLNTCQKSFFTLSGTVILDGNIRIPFSDIETGCGYSNWMGGEIDLPYEEWTQINSISYENVRIIDNSIDPIFVNGLRNLLNQMEKEKDTSSGNTGSSGGSGSSSSGVGNNNDTESTARTSTTGSGSNVNADNSNWQQTSQSQQQNEALRRQVDTYLENSRRRQQAMEQAAEGLNKVYANIFSGSSERGFEKMQANFARQKEEIRASVRKYGEEWLARRNTLLLYNVSILSLLTDQTFEGLSDGSIAEKNLPLLERLSTQDLNINPAKVIERVARRGYVTQNDSIYISSYWVTDTRHYLENPGFLRRLQWILDDVQILNEPDFMTNGLPFPYMTASHTPIVAFPADVLIKYTKDWSKDPDFDIDNQIIQWMKPGGKEHIGIGEPLLIATSSREEAELIQAEVSGRNIYMPVGWLKHVFTLESSYYVPNDVTSAPESLMVAASKPVIIPDRNDKQLEQQALFEEIRSTIVGSKPAVQAYNFMGRHTVTFTNKDIRKKGSGYCHFEIIMESHTHNTNRGQTVNLLDIPFNMVEFKRKNKMYKSEHEGSSYSIFTVYFGDRSEAEKFKSLIEKLELACSSSTATSGTNSMNMEELYNLARKYEAGDGVEQNYENALEFYQRSAEQGYTNAQFKLGYFYYTGRGVEKNYKEAVNWYRRAAGQGNYSAQNNLGFMYEKGYGIDEDKSMAVHWYRKAAEQGFALAQSNLGGMYRNGLGVAQNYEEAVKWYLRAAKQGNAKAQYNYGDLNRRGLGVAQNYEEAVKWYSLAAEQGNIYAQNNLGFMYAKGYGIDEDNSKAVQWYRKAAEQGYALGQYNLGLKYEFGVGVPKDMVEAMNWYRKAAEQGHENAKSKLEQN